MRHPIALTIAIRLTSIAKHFGGVNCFHDAIYSWFIPLLKPHALKHVSCPLTEQQTVETLSQFINANQMINIFIVGGNCS